jgi:hypothetical protein
MVHQQLIDDLAWLTFWYLTALAILFLESYLW